MKKAVLIIASVLTLGAGLASSASAVSLPQYFVDPENGADSATCGGSSLANPATGPCQSLNQAMQNGGVGVQITIMRPGTFGPILINGPIGISGPPEGQAFIQWSSTPPGCKGGAPGSCNGNANATYAVDVEGGSNAAVKLKNITVGGGSGAAASADVPGRSWPAREESS